MEPHSGLSPLGTAQRQDRIAQMALNLIANILCHDWPSRVIREGWGWEEAEPTVQVQALQECSQSIPVHANSSFHSHLQEQGLWNKPELISSIQPLTLVLEQVPASSSVKCGPQWGILKNDIKLVNVNQVQGMSSKPSMQVRFLHALSLLLPRLGACHHSGAPSS